jgi:hypothetical protein
MAQGQTIYRWSADADDWKQVADFTERGLGTITRLAVSPGGDRLALVVDETVPEETSDEGEAASDPEESDDSEP